MAPEVADATKRLIAIVAAQTDQQISRLECHAVGEEIAKGDFAVSNRIWKDDGRQNVSDAIVPAQFFLVDESGDHRRIERLRKRGDIELRVGIDRSGAAEASDTVALCDDDAFSVDDHDRQTRHIPVLSSFLDKRGEGLHHVTFKTDDIRAAIDHLRAQGYELVDVNIENPHWKEAFLRPSKSHGTLIQIAQSYAPDDVVKDRLRPSNLDDLLR